MTEWIEPMNNALEGFNAFLGQVTPSLMWIGLILFIGFTIVFVTKKVLGET